MQATVNMAGGVEPGVPYSRGAMVRALQLMAPCGTGAERRAELLNVAATWTVFIDGSGQAVPAPRLRSIRKRGSTPSYPRPARFEAMTEGTLILFPNGFVLEPGDPRHPCTNIAESGVLAATFYRDAFEVWIGARDRLLIRTDPVEHIDSIFQAYFWNPVP